MELTTTKKKKSADNLANRAASHGVVIELCFFVSLVGVAFHPDIDFRRYVHAVNGKSLFSWKGAARLNGRLQECHRLCELYEIDIYKLANATIEPILKMIV
jgi:hypothetical protein